MCTLILRLPQASLPRSASFFSGAVFFVRRTLARSAFHGFSMGFQRRKRGYFAVLISFLQSRVLAAPSGHMLRITGIFFDSVQPLLALSEQRALCTFFPLLLAASLRPDGFVSGAVSFVRRTLARSAFLGFQIGVPRCKSAFHGF